MCVVKDSFRTSFGTFFTKNTLTVFEIYLRKTTVTFDDYVCFTDLDALITLAADVGKLDIITAPRWTYNMGFTTIKKTATT